MKNIYVLEYSYTTIYGIPVASTYYKSSFKEIFEEYVSITDIIKLEGNGTLKINLFRVSYGEGNNITAELEKLL